MIKLVRLDERLIHGQVATKLLNSLDVDTCVVIDDKAAADTVQKSALMMAVVGAGLSGKIKTSVKDTDTAIRMLNDPRCNPKKILIVVGKPDTLLRVSREVPGVTDINIGNYGNMAAGEDPRKTIHDSLKLSDKEAEMIKEIVNDGKNIYYQRTPDSEKKYLKDLL